MWGLGMKVWGLGWEGWVGRFWVWGGVIGHEGLEFGVGVGYKSLVQVWDLGVNVCFLGCGF